jgi:amino acid transporter
MALTTVDHSALKVNQTGIVATVLVAFIGSYFFRPLLVLIPLLAVVLLLGTFAPQLALFKQLYFKVLKPRGIVKPRPVQDRPEPHNFAQGLGGVFLAVSSLFLYFGTPASASTLLVIGLAIALLVAVLAFVNLAFGYCLGCQIYYQLGKRGLIRA